MIHRHRLLCLLFLLAAHVTGCTTTHPVDSRLTPQLVTHAAGLDSIPQPLTPSPAERGKPALLHRLTDAIGLSTPEGRARRQAVKLAKATAPKVGKGGVYAVNSNVSSGFKARAPVTTADTGATVSNAAENSQQQVVPGDNNQLTADKHDTTQQAKSWQAELATPVGKAVALIGSLVALAAFGGICFYLWPYLPKRKKATDNLS